MQQGDIIKFGRIKFQVRHIKLDNNPHTNNSHKKEEPLKNNFVRNEIIKNTIQNNFNNTSEVNEVEEIEEINQKNEIKQGKKKICRICYGDENELDSPLINPCSCSGGVKYIHLECLQSWLKSRCITKSNLNDNCINYTIKQYECELCKVMLPDFVKVNNKLYEIWDFLKPNFKNYLCLESVITDKYNLRNIFMINLDFKNVLKVGRSHDADLRITDISVSRFHAQITRCRDNTLRVEDISSKFGSLVLIQHPKVPISIEPGLPLQIGRSLLYIYEKKPFKFFNCFTCDGSPRKLIDYSNLNKNYIDMDKIFSVKLQNDTESSVMNSNEKPKINEIVDDEISHHYLNTSSNNEEENYLPSNNIKINEKSFFDDRRIDTMKTLNICDDNLKSHFSSQYNPNFIKDKDEYKIPIRREKSSKNLDHRSSLKDVYKKNTNLNLTINTNVGNNNYSHNKSINRLKKRHSLFNIPISHMPFGRSLLPILGNINNINNINTININLTPKLNLIQIKRYEEDIIDEDPINLADEMGVLEVEEDRYTQKIINEGTKLEKIQEERRKCRVSRRKSGNYIYSNEVTHGDISSVKETDRNLK